MWQALYEELGDTTGLMVVAVAEDSRGAERARPWIEQANTTYWTLIDVDHRVSDLYGMVNVPQAVWIDQRGRVARPAETAGSTDHFRQADRKTFQMPPDAVAERQASKEAYLNAVRAWARTGAHALDENAVARAQPRMNADIARAHAHFKLGAWLHRHGRAAEGEQHLVEASRLHPDSWSVWRQAADLAEIGKAAGADFWKRVDALGDRPYYPAPDIPGFRPTRPSKSTSD